MEGQQKWGILGEVFPFPLGARGWSVFPLRDSVRLLGSYQSGFFFDWEVAQGSILTMDQLKRTGWFHWVIVACAKMQKNQQTISSSIVRKLGAVALSIHFIWDFVGSLMFDEGFVNGLE